MSKTNLFAAVVILVVIVGGGLALYKLDDGQGDRAASVQGKNISGQMAAD